MEAVTVLDPFARQEVLQDEALKDDISHTRKVPGQYVGLALTTT